MTSYYNLAITNFYLGRIEKSEYYINRVMRGKLEAMYSFVKKVAIINIDRKYKGIKCKPYKSDDFSNKWSGGEILNIEQIEKGLQHLFSNHLKNYSLMNDEVLMLLDYHQTRKFHFKSKDPTVPYIKC